LGAWWSVSTETAETHAEWSFTTSVGLSVEEPTLKFLQTGNADQVRAICCLQGKATRHLVASVLLGGAESGEADSLPEGLDLDEELPPSLQEAGWPVREEPGGVRIALRPFFKHLIQVMLEAERKCLWLRVGDKVVALAAVVFTFLPCFGRLLEGRPFFGEDMLMATAIGLYLLPLLLLTWVSLMFPCVAIRDMWRRRALMQCCVALLSTLPQDRLYVPWQITALGVVDTRDPKAVEAFLHLRELCKDWGRFYSLRCGAFVDAYAASSAVCVAGLLVLIEFQLYQFISRSLLLAVLAVPVVLGACIVTLAVIGDGVNSTTSRLAALLQRHARSIKETVLGLEMWNQGHSAEYSRLLSAVRCLTAARRDIAADQDPVKLLGLRCGLSVLTALYAIPVFVCIRLRHLCEEQPDICGFMLP